MKKIISIIKRSNIDFYCFNCLHSCRTKNKLELHKKVCENKDFCDVIIPSESTKTLEFINIKNLIKHHLLFMQIFNV